MGMGYDSVWSAGGDGLWHSGDAGANWQAVPLPIPWSGPHPAIQVRSDGRGGLLIVGGGVLMHGQ